MNISVFALNDSGGYFNANLSLPRWYWLWSLSAGGNWPGTNRPVQCGQHQCKNADVKCGGKANKKNLVHVFSNRIEYEFSSSNAYANSKWTGEHVFIGPSCAETHEISSASPANPHNGTQDEKETIGTFVALETTLSSSQRGTEMKNVKIKTPDSKLVVVCSANDALQAELVKNMLVDHGIQATTGGENQTGFTGAFPVKVFVRECDLATATDFIGRHFPDL